MTTIVRFIGAMLGLSIGLWCAGCPSSSQPPVSPPIDADATPALPPDAGITADCTAACAGLARSGCATVQPCARVLCQIQADPHFRPVDLACLARATSPEAVRACGADCTVVDEEQDAQPPARTRLRL